MSDYPVRTRDSMGRWLPGQSPNPRGRLPRQTEAKYLEVTMEKCTVEDWAEIITIAIEDAKDKKSTAHIRARAREWLGKHLIGEPSQLHQLLYKEEREFHITVTFGDNGSKALEAQIPEIIDVEPVVVEDASRDKPEEPA